MAFGSPMRLRSRCRASGGAANRVAYLRTSATTLAGGLLPTVINGYGWVLAATGDVSAYVHPLTNYIGVIANGGQSLENGTRDVTPTTVLSTTQPYSNVTFLGGPKSQKVGNAITTVNTLMPDGTTPTMSALKPMVEDVRASFTTDPVAGLQGETWVSAFASGATARAFTDYAVAVDAHPWFGSTPARGGLLQVSIIKGSAQYALVKDHIDNAYTLVNAIP